MKILILGVGNAQVDAIEYLKSQNIDVHGISYRKEGVGLRLVDTFDLVNIANKEAVLAYAKEKNFDVIYSVGSDVAMPTASYVSEVLGKPHFVTESIADLLQDKVLFREFQVKHNIKPLPAQKIKTIKDAENWNNYPAIIKPVDSQGQRGVYEVFSHEDISNNLEQSLSFSRKKEVILEKYVDGPELCQSAFNIDPLSASKTDPLKVKKIFFISLLILILATKVAQVFSLARMGCNCTFVGAEEKTWADYQQHSYSLFFNR